MNFLEEFISALGNFYSKDTSETESNKKINNLTINI